MNKVLTITEIKTPDYPYTMGGREGRLLHVKTAEGESFLLDKKEVNGWAIGQKLRYLITPLGEEDTKELDAAYATISDLVEKARELASKAQKGRVAQKAFVVSALANLAALAWNVFS